MGTIFLVILLVCPYARSVCTVRKHNDFLYLKSVLDNSGSRQGQEATNSMCQEATNSTCHEVMRVHKNEHIFTNIINNGYCLKPYGSYFLSFSPVFLFPSPFFFSPFPPFVFFPPPHLFFPPSHTPYPTFLFSFFILPTFLDLVTMDVPLNVNVKFSQVLANCYYYHSYRIMRNNPPITITTIIIIITIMIYIIEI